MSQKEHDLGEAWTWSVVFGGARWWTEDLSEAKEWNTDLGEAWKQNCRHLCAEFM